MLLFVLSPLTVLFDVWDKLTFSWNVRTCVGTICTRVYLWTVKIFVSRICSSLWCFIIHLGLNIGFTIHVSTLSSELSFSDVPSFGAIELITEESMPESSRLTYECRMRNAIQMR